MFHISARAVACSALSIFGDHTDVMATRSCGWGMLASGSVQEVMDLALVAQAATLESRVPFVHFFDGFRTSSEVQKVEELTYEDMRAMIDMELVRAHRARALSPDRPAIRGTSQNPDVFFAARESVNKYYLATPAIVQKAFDRFAKLVGRQYHLFDYVGAPDAERIVIMMGSGAEAMEEVVAHLVAQGEKVGLVKVRLFRPFSVEHLLGALPATVKAIAVLDRTKEPGSLGEPLYEDVRTAIGEAMASGQGLKAYPAIVGGRYGLGSREFNPGMAKAVLDNLKDKAPKNHFTIGIIDDLTHSSLDWDNDFSPAGQGVHQALFFGLGADGTVGANKNSIKIIGKATDNYAQGYFVYDSKKSGVRTVSHLRFGPQPIKSTYLVQKANFVACHKFSFLEKIDMLSAAEQGGTFLLASPYGKEEVWEHLPVEVQKQIIEKHLKFYVIDALKIAEAAGLGWRINTIMQTAFFLISGVLPEARALELIKQAVEDTYGGKGRDVIEMNLKGVEAARKAIEQVSYPKSVKGELRMSPARSGRRPEVRARGDRGDHRRARRPPAGVQAARRRHLAQRHHPVREAQHRRGDPGLGAGGLHPVRRVLPDLPARGHSHQGLRPRAAVQCPAELQEPRGPRQGVRRQEVHRAGVAGGLHRLRPVRADLSRGGEEGRAEDRPQSRQYVAPAPAAGPRVGQLGVLP